MSKSLSIESLSKKLRTVANTQDSIPMLSVWIIHHKANHQVIVNKWLECMKEAKPSHRLTLFYLANDVIQNCHRKKAPVFKESFGEVLPEAITYLRDDTILPNIERVLTVWSRRNIYESETIDDLYAALLTNKPPDKLKQRLLAEYKPSTLIELISAFKKQEEQILIEEKQLSRSRVDVSSTDDIHKLKDKIGGEKFSRNFEESACHLEQFITEFEKYVEQRKQLVDALLQGSVFYSAQYHEAKIVVNAYKSFNNRVMKMKRMSDQVKLKLSASLSPPFDAPSPENSPQQENEPDDMDMSDSDQELGSKPSKIVSVDTNVLRPIPPQRFRHDNDLTKRIASLDTTQITENPRSGGVITRPGMRGASSSSALLSSFQEAFTKQTSSSSVSKVSNNSTPIGKIPSASPSASPPSPTGSPELNIASPPRHQSLESRLADIFSQNPKAIDVNDNTGSESDTESIPPDKSVSDNEHKNTTKGGPSLPIVGLTESIISKLAAGTSSFSPDTSGKNRNGDKNSLSSLSSNSPSWQNAIPVIGGMRNFNSSLLENLKSLIKKEESGDSTPLQDENLDINRTPGKKKEFQIETITSSHTEKISEMALPPPSFSGDALNFLTKFMGGQTAAKDLEPFSQWSDSQNDTFPGLDIKRKNRTDETSIKLQEDGMWREQPIRTTLDWAREKNGKVTKQDTDYRMQKNNDRENSKTNSDIPSTEGSFERDVHESTLGILSANLKPVSISNIFNARHRSKEDVGRFNSDEKSEDSVDQFKNILRKKSSEQSPQFAPLSSTEKLSFSFTQHTTEDLIVEEEEIELDEDVPVNLNAGNDSNVHAKSTMENSFQTGLPDSNNHHEINDFMKSKSNDHVIQASSINNSKHLNKRTLISQPPLNEVMVRQTIANDTYYNELESSFIHKEHPSHFDRRLPPNYPLPDEGFRRQPQHPGARPYPGPYERHRRPYGRRPPNIWDQEVRAPAMRHRFPPQDNRPFGGFHERGGRGIRGARPRRFMPRNPYY